MVLWEGLSAREFGGITENVKQLEKAGNMLAAEEARDKRDAEKEERENEETLEDEEQLDQTQETNDEIFSNEEADPPNI